MHLINFRVLALALALVGFGACGDDTCEEFNLDLESCYDSHCSTSSSPFCGCWNNGGDINVATCECIERASHEQICDTINLEPYEQNGFNCSSASAVVDNLCNGGD